MQTINATQGIRILDTKASATLLSKVLWITTVGFLFTAFGAYIRPKPPASPSASSFSVSSCSSPSAGLHNALPRSALPCSISSRQSWA